jgi:hypothetical protein
MGKEYPELPVFTTTMDAGGRRFGVAYFNRGSNAVVGLGDELLVIPGNPKISIRQGRSHHGEELIVELLRTGAVRTFPKNTGHDGIEIYFPLAEGIRFLRLALAHFERLRGGVET